MEEFSSLDLLVFREKSRAYCGSFKVPLEKLRAEDPPQNPRQLDQKNVIRLVRVYQKEGCWPLDHGNHVEVVIPQSTLAELPPKATDEFPFFDPKEQLVYLNGQHRIEAARKFLTGNDRWWIADLYYDLSEQVKNVLREQDPNCKKCYDGDTLRHARISTLRGDTARRERFLAELSKTKQDLVKRLEAQPPWFLGSLDDLIPFVGLWAVNIVGSFGRIINLHMPEEMTRYLRRMKNIWIEIIGESVTEQSFIDANTVYLVQGRCPGRSIEDRAFIQMKMLAGELFPAIKNESRRSEILERLCSIKHIIPSLYTFLRNYNYLESGSKILKNILLSKCRGSLSQHFHAMHSGQRTIKVQTKEFEFEDRTFPSGLHASWVGYRQLWSLILRHCPVMQGPPPRQDLGKPNDWLPGKEYIWWAELCSLAAESGYKRIHAIYYDRKAAQLSMVLDFVRKMLDPMYYKIDSEKCQRKSRLIYELLFCDAEFNSPIKGSLELTSDHDDAIPSVEDRYGRPRTTAFYREKSYNFFDNFYSTSYDDTPKRYLTSLAVTRDRFLSFFGTEMDDLDSSYIPHLWDRPRASEIVYNPGQDTDVTDQSVEEQPDSAPDIPSSYDEIETLEKSSPDNQDLAPAPASLEQRLTDRHERSVTSPRGRSRSPGRSYGELNRRERSPLSRRRRGQEDSTDHDPTEGAVIPFVRGIASNSETVKFDTIPQVSSPPDTQIFEKVVDVASIPQVFPSSPAQSASASMFAFESGDRFISLEVASRYLYRKRTTTKPRGFNIISPAGNNKFLIRQVDSTNTKSMLDALPLQSNVPFITSDRVKRIKLTAPTVILDEARSQNLETALVASKQNPMELVRQFREFENSNDDLYHKPSKIINLNNNPIQIKIWSEGNWRIAKKNVKYNQAEKEINQYLQDYPDLRPYDWEGNYLLLKDCYDAAQKDSPPAIYLCTPSDAEVLFPIEI